MYLLLLLSRKFVYFKSMGSPNILLLSIFFGIILLVYGGFICFFYFPFYWKDPHSSPNDYNLKVFTCLLSDYKLQKWVFKTTYYHIIIMCGDGWSSWPTWGALASPWKLTSGCIKESLSRKLNQSKEDPPPWTLMIHSLGCGPVQSKGIKGAESLQSSFSASWLQICDQLLHTLPAGLSHHNGLYTLKCKQSKPFFLKLLFPGI